jgi:hypothetical protein
VYEGVGEITVRAKGEARGGRRDPTHRHAMLSLVAAGREQYELRTQRVALRSFEEIYLD